MRFKDGIETPLFLFIPRESHSQIFPLDTFGVSVLVSEVLLQVYRGRYLSTTRRHGLVDKELDSNQRDLGSVPDTTTNYFWVTLHKLLNLSCTSISHL